MHSSLILAAALLGATQAAIIPGLIKRITSNCSPTGQLSCSGTVTNTCCTESPGGLLLHPQFWDTSPSTGPSDSFTIHGLWPDNCDGTFPSNCDSSRAYTGFNTLLPAQGAQSTLDYMNTYWVDVNGQNEQFWEHEWSKHGTCMSTLVPSCLPGNNPTGAEAVAFFNTVTGLHKKYQTYSWLSQAGIVPSTSATYTLAQLNAAVKSHTGQNAAWDCTSGALGGVSYYYSLRGSIVDGTFVDIAPKAGTCPSTGIKFPFKSGGSGGTPTTTSSGGGSTGTPGNLPAKGTIHASSTGGLLSAGTWSTQTLATYTFSGSANSFTMSSSKGNCGVSSGSLSCGSGVSSTTFSAVTSGSSLLLASGGSTAWTSDGTPSGSTVQTVYTGSSKSSDYTLAIVSS